jgi:predicted transcriptional regulator
VSWLAKAFAMAKAKIKGLEYVERFLEMISNVEKQEDYYENLRIMTSKAMHILVTVESLRKL